MDEVKDDTETLVEPKAPEEESAISEQPEAPPEQPEATEQEPEPEIEKVDESKAAAAAAEEPPLSPNSVASKKSKDGVKLKIVLLEGKDLDVEEKSKSTTETVVDPAHEESQTLETDYFSVYFFDNYEREHKEHIHRLKQKIFLVPRKRLKAQFSAQEKAALGAEPWTYYYGVKFYVPDPKILKDDHSRFLFCLQVCDDIRANRIRVDKETAIRLSAIMLQGKLGDYNEEEHQSGYYHQFPQFQLIPDSLKPDNYEAQLIEVHKAKAGYTPAQADMEFLTIAKDLSRYGEHLFLAKTMRDNNHEDCRVVTIGNGCKGISVYPEDKEERELHVPWRDIVKISYKSDKFRIIYHPAESEAPGEDTEGKKPKPITKKYYTGRRPQAKRLWKNAVEQHVFFHLESIKSPTIVSNLFLRSSMRYSFKKTLHSAKKNPDQMEDKKDRSREVHPRQLAPEDGEEFVMLPFPPLYDPEASKQQEHQRVQVDFKSEDDEPADAHRFIIRRGQIGSLELLDSFKPDKEDQKDFRLSMVDEDSKAATVSVSLNIDPPKGVTLTTGGKEVKGVAVFDSERMPVVNMGSASKVTTGTTIEQDGKQLSAGEHSHKYPLEEATTTQGTEEKLAGPPGGGAGEREQVNQFLEKEHELFQKVSDESVPTAIEIPVSS